MTTELIEREATVGAGLGFGRHLLSLFSPTPVFFSYALLRGRPPRPPRPRPAFIEEMWAGEEGEVFEKGEVFAKEYPPGVFYGVIVCFANFAFRPLAIFAGRPRVCGAHSSCSPYV